MKELLNANVAIDHMIHLSVLLTGKQQHYRGTYIENTIASKENKQTFNLFLRLFADFSYVLIQTIGLVYI